MREDHTPANDSLLSATQLSALGLAYEPFITPKDAALLYNDSHQEMSTNIVLKSLANEAKAIVLIAESGAGKTTFLRKILHITHADIESCACRIGAGQTFQQISAKIKQKWSLPDGAEAPAELSIENHVICYLQKHPKLLLLIDDADQLDLASLAQLLQLKHRIEQTHPHALGLLMTGDHKLKLQIITLEEANPSCSANYQINIRPLNREQTHRYVRFRLSNAASDANHPAEDLLDHAALDAVYKASRGNFTKIHAASIEALNQLQRRPLTQPPRKSTCLTAITIIGLVTILVLLTCYLAVQLGIAY